MRHRHSLVAVLIASLLLTPSVLAQQSLVAPADLDAAIAEKARTERDQRALVVSVLQDDHVRQLAKNLSLDIVRVEDAVATLSGPDLARAAESANAIQNQLSGEASTVTISLTTLLLVLIIVILIAD